MNIRDTVQGIFDSGGSIRNGIRIIAAHFIFKVLQLFMNRTKLGGNSIEHG